MSLLLPQLNFEKAHPEFRVAMRFTQYLSGARVKSRDVGAGGSDRQASNQVFLWLAKCQTEPAQQAHRFAWIRAAWFTKAYLHLTSSIRLIVGGSSSWETSDLQTWKGRGEKGAGKKRKGRIMKVNESNTISLWQAQCLLPLESHFVRQVQYW